MKYLTGIGAICIIMFGIIFSGGLAVLSLVKIADWLGLTK